MSPTVTNPLGQTNSEFRSHSRPPAAPAQGHRPSYSPQLHWPQSHRSTPAETLQNADHDALIMSGNRTYAALLTQLREISAKYETLEKAYFLLATSVPQVFRTIPNIFGLDLPSSDSETNNSNALSANHSNSTLRSHDDFPDVQFWYRKEFKDNDLATVGGDEKHQKLGFLEYEDGTQYTKDEIKAQRRHARTAFGTLLLRGLAPPTWSQASSVAVNWFRAEMLTHCPDLGLCAANWKVDVLATERKSVEEESSEEEDIDLQPPKNKKQKADPKPDKSKSKKEKRRGKKKAAPNSSTSSSRPSPAATMTPEPTQPPSRATSQPPSRAASVSPAGLATSASAGPANPSVPASSSVINPLSGMFGKPILTAGRLKVTAQTAIPSSSSTSSNPVSSTSANPVSSTSINPVSSSSTNPAPTDSNSSSTSHAPVPASSKPARKSKSKPHKPGSAHTAWNIFGRKHMQDFPAHTTEDARVAFKNLSPAELQKLKVKAAAKKIELGGKTGPEKESVLSSPDDSDSSED
ncbi:hypothetical protein C8F04DRAFT_1263335 [Mycena alexandri]|uniref:Uncharacterized protein n=1 Tax=Mycena alexandri TaxID=1745969 RepID=A0AAD6SNZ2_9AGAR|nr:hypothetical protein C8F04DRAFT_1263335 [Mycena alexandri]